MATHWSILTWRTPWTEEPGRPQSTRSQTVRHDWATKHAHKRSKHTVGPLVGATGVQRRARLWYRVVIRVLPRVCDVRKEGRVWGPKGDMEETREGVRKWPGGGGRPIRVRVHRLCTDSWTTSTTLHWENKTMQQPERPENKKDFITKNIARTLKR